MRRIPSKNTLKYLSVILLLLFLLWWSSPYWARQLLQQFLPQNWQLITLKMARPGISSLQIFQVEIRLENGTQLKAKNIFLPYSYQSNPTRIEFLNIVLNNTTVRKKQNIPQKIIIPSIQPINLPLTLNIPNVSISNEDFRLQGKLKTNPAALSFEGQLDWQKSKLAIELYLTGLNGREDLQIAAQLGKQQQLSINFPWKNEKDQQKLQLTAKAGKQFFKLLAGFNIIPKNEIAVKNPNLAVTLQLAWLTKPKSLKQLLQAKITGAAEFSFDAISTKGFRANKNHLLMKFNREKFEVSTTSNLTVLGELKNKPLKIKIAPADIVISHIKNQQIQFSSLPVIDIRWGKQSIIYTADNLFYNLTASRFSGKGSILAKIVANEFITSPKPIKPGDFNIKTQLEFHYKKEQLSLVLSENSISQFSENISLNSKQNLRLSALRIFNNPVKIDLKLTNHDPVSMISTQLNTGGEISFKILSDKLKFNTQCHYQLNKTEITLTCQALPLAMSMVSLNLPRPTNEGNKTIDKSAQKINLSAKLNFNSKLLDLTINSNFLTSKSWPFTTFFSKIKSATWTTNFQIQSSLNLNNPNLSIESIFNSVIPGSTFTLNIASVSFANAVISQAKASYHKNNNNMQTLDLTITDIVRKGGLVVKNLRSKLITNDFKKTQGTASFNIFQGLFSIPTTEIKLTAKKQQIVVNVTHLNLALLFNFLDIKGLEVSGLVDGKLPILLNGLGISFKNGEFHATTAGEIKYKSPSDNTPFEQQNIALQALQDFHYQALSIGIDVFRLLFNETGFYRLPMRIIGNNPAVIMGKSIAINPVLKGKIPKETWKYLIYGDFKKAFTDKLTK